MTEQTDLSSQSTCDCDAAIGQTHHQGCQYVADVLAQEAEKIAARLSR